MADITYIAQEVDLPSINQEITNRWIEEVAHSFGKSVGAMTYIFCNDQRIIEVNNQYLQHDYFTDIITFDYSRPLRISGDMFISLDTVKSNAEMLHKDYEDELNRVIIHGVLHLCGVDDKGEGEREIMEMHENTALSLLEQLKNNQSK